MCIKKLGAVCLSVVLLISMLVIGNVLPAAATAEQADVEVFEADFTGWNKNGSGIAYLEGSTDLQNYLLGKFAFYRNQEGTYFERPHVNGYVADADGNSITTQNATKTTAAYAPDTGLAMDGDEYIDYTGNGTGPLAKWGVEWNQLQVVDRTGLDMYRNSNWMYVKNTDGSLASLTNFRLEVKFHSLSVANGTFAVLFRGTTAGNPLGSLDQQLLSVYPNDGTVYFGNNFVRNESAHSDSMGAAMTTDWYTATVEVVGDKMTFTLADFATGSTVYTTTKTLTVLHSGYLGIGGSLGGVAYQNVKVTRLDENGDAIDFSDTSDGWDFYANLHGLGEYRDSYHWLMGSESAVKGYYRDNGGADFAWLQKVNTGTSFWSLYSMDTTQTTDQAILNYLNSKFSLNFEGQGWDRSYDKAIETKFSGHSQSGEAYLSLYAGRYLNAVYTAQGTDGQNNIQKALSLQPKKQDGTYYQLKNFETAFEMSFNAAQATSANAFYFRATNKGGVASNATASVLVFNVNGYQFFDGTGPSNTYDYTAYTPWADNATASNIRVYVKVVDTALTLKVTSLDGQTVYADTTMTISDGDAGYLHYTMINGNNAFGGIRFSEVTEPVHTCDFATPNYDATGHWNECECGEKDQVIAHTLKYAVDGDKHYQACDCGYKTTAVEHDYTDESNICVCGTQKDNTVVIDAENNLVKVKVGAGYQVAPGSLLVKDGDTNYVPVRVGFQSNDTQSAQYQVLTADGSVMDLTADMQGVATFVADADATAKGAMGFLGTSVNTEKDGLRFVHRMNITTDTDGSYIIVNGVKQKLKDYGILVAAKAVLDNPNDLDIETANASMHIAQFYYLDGADYNTALNDTNQTNKYYDISDSYVDISMMVTGITEAIDDYEFITRTYVVLENGEVVYGDAAISSYAAAQ